MTASVDPRGGLLARAAAVLVALGVVVTGEFLVTIEWTFAYCSDPQDGPASAVFGAPLPYERWSGYSSMVYEFMPHVWLLDLALLFALVYPLARWSLRRAPRRLRAGLGGLGLGLSLLLSMVDGALAGGHWEPVVSIAQPPYDAYLEYRPIAVSIGTLRRYECTPSPWWFERSASEVESAIEPQAGGAAPRKTVP